MKHVHITLEESLYERLRALCGAEYGALSTYIRNLVKRSIGEDERRKKERCEALGEVTSNVEVIEEQ